MINHLHLIGFIREILKNIRQTEPNVLKIFRVQVRDTEPTVRVKPITYNVIS